MTKPDDSFICLGALSGSFGVHGEIRVKSFCADPTAISDYGPLTSDTGETYTLTLTRPVKGGYAGHLQGIKTKEQADALKGMKLWIKRDKLPDLPDDEFYYEDLIGLAVFDTGGAELGTVTSVNDHGAGDILEMRPKVGNVVLIPFTKAIVPTVDLQAGRIVIDPPEGLLSTPKAETKEQKQRPSLEWD